MHLARNDHDSHPEKLKLSKKRFPKRPYYKCTEVITHHHHCVVVIEALLWYPRNRVTDEDFICQQSKEMKNKTGFITLQLLILRG